MRKDVIAKISAAAGLLVCSNKKMAKTMTSRVQE